MFVLANKSAEDPVVTGTDIRILKPVNIPLIFVRHSFETLSTHVHLFLSTFSRFTDIDIKFFNLPTVCTFAIVKGDVM